MSQQYGESSIGEAMGRAIELGGLPRFASLSPNPTGKIATKSATLDMIAEINLELNDLRSTVNILRSNLQHITLNGPQPAVGISDKTEKPVPSTVVHGELKAIIDSIRSVHREIIEIKNTIVI